MPHERRATLTIRDIARTIVGMVSDSGSATDTFGYQEWQRIVSDHAPELWARELTEVDSGAALDIGYFAFLTLADHLAELSEDSVRSWLSEIACRSIEEAASSLQWRTSAPYLGRSNQALEEFIDRAERAISLGVDPDRLASPVAAETSESGVDHGVSAPWRSVTDTDELLPTPDSVWRGRYSFREYTADLVLLGGSSRRMLGTITPPGTRRVRTRGTTEWITTDAHGRFRIEPIPPGPASIEVDTAEGSFATEWALL